MSSPLCPSAPSIVTTQWMGGVPTLRSRVCRRERDAPLIRRIGHALCAVGLGGVRVVFEGASVASRAGLSAFCALFDRSAGQWRRASAQFHRNCRPVGCRRVRAASLWRGKNKSKSADRSHRRAVNDSVAFPVVAAAHTGHNGRGGGGGGGVMAVWAV